MDMLDLLLKQERLIGKVELLIKQNRRCGRQLDSIKKRIDKLGN